MKKAAIIAVVLLVAAAVCTLFMFESCKVTVTYVSATAVDAATRSEQFNQLSIQVMEDCVIGTKFADVSSLSDPENYQLLTYTVSIKNGCFVPAEMVEIQITPMGDDVMQIGDTQQHSIPARSDATQSVTILTGKSMHPVREINISYYIFGKPYHIRTTYSGK